MIDNIFDNKVRDILKNLTMKYTPDSWKRLESKLDNIEKEDAIFDSIIAGKLKNHSVIASDSAYNKFEKRTGTLRNKNYIYYIVGLVAAILLLWFTVMNLDRGQTNSHKSSLVVNNENKIKINKVTDKKFDDRNLSNLSTKNIVTIETSADLDDISFHDIKNDLATGFINNSTVDKSRNTIPDLQKTKQVDVYDNNLNVGMNFNNVMDLYSIDNYSYLTPILGKIKKQNLATSVLYNSTQEKSLNLPIYTNIKNRYFNINKNIVTVYNEEEKKENPEVNEIVSDSEKYIGQHEEKLIIENDLIKKMPRISNGLIVGASFGPNVNFVNTPNDLIFNIPSYNTFSSGISGGISASIKKAKNEFESGLEYHIVNSTPKKTQSKVDDTKSYYLDNIKYDIVKVPLNYKYHAFENEAWDIYSISGVSANIIANSEYEFVEQTKIGGIDWTIPTTADKLQNDNDFNQSLYAKKTYDEGAFEGGRINNNIYFALNAGFGVKRKMINGFSLYFEPQFNYNFNTFGPNNDKIMNLNLKLGVSKTISL